jgi:hypothetical protein
MGYKDVTEGQKTAKVKSGRFIKSKNGTTALEVAFEFTEPSTDRVEHLPWQGWLSEKALDNTMDTLVNVLGYNGSKIIDSDGVLTDPNAFAYGREVRLVIEIEDYTNEKGETKAYPKIKWVNSLGGSNYTGITPESIKNELGSIGFEAAFLAAKKTSGPVNYAPQTATKNDNVPF